MLRAVKCLAGVADPSGMEPSASGQDFPVAGKSLGRNPRKGEQGDSGKRGLCTGPTCQLHRHTFINICALLICCGCHKAPHH